MTRNIIIVNQITFTNRIYLIFRFVHIGPILTAFINGKISPRNDATHNAHLFDPHIILPVTNNETTVILCANALNHSIAATTLELNAVILRYGFQVRIPEFLIKIKRTILELSGYQPDSKVLL